MLLPSCMENGSGYESNNGRCKGGGNRLWSVWPIAWRPNDNYKEFKIPALENMDNSLVNPASEHLQQPAESNIYHQPNILKKYVPKWDCSHYGVVPCSVIWFAIPGHMHPCKWMILLKQEIPKARWTILVLSRRQSKKGRDWDLATS